MPLPEDVHKAFDAVDKWITGLPHETTCPIKYQAGAECVCWQAAGLALLNRLFEAVSGAAKERGR